MEVSHPVSMGIVQLGVLFLPSLVAANSNASPFSCSDSSLPLVCFWQIVFSYDVFITLYAVESSSINIFAPRINEMLDVEIS